jgi:hypothetical protein
MMIHMIFLIGGVCCALLCHWMIRHTYTYRLEETGEKDWIGRPEQRKVWDKKLVLPRWKFILIWIVCILLAPIAIIAPIVVGVVIGIACSEGEARFIYTNRLIEWLKKEV